MRSPLQKGFLTPGLRQGHKRAKSSQGMLRTQTIKRKGQKMKFYKYLYIGGTLSNPAKVKRKLKCHAGVNVYVITVASGDDQLEIFHSAYLKQRYYRYHPPVIVGIASNYGEAVEIVTGIAQECVSATGNCNLKEYLKQKAKQVQ